MADEKRTVNDIIEEQIKFSDMAKKDLALLPKVLVLVQKRKSKSTKKPYFQITFKLHDQLKRNVMIDESEYNVICLDFPEESNGNDEFVIKVSAILTTGKYTDDENYFRIQLGLGITVYRNMFLTPVENRLVKEHKLESQFTYRDKRIDKEEF